MQENKSLREWARENKIWELKSWEIFLKDYILPFYRQTYILMKFYDFLKSEKIIGKGSLADIDDEILRNKIRVAIYGGAENPETSFAKFMYDQFGLCAENVHSFEESIKMYENYGDGIKVSINQNSWIYKIKIKDLKDTTFNIIQYIINNLDLKLKDLGIQEDYLYDPVKDIEPESLLPLPGENPEKLISLINEFIQGSINLSFFVNPFTTFILYSRAIPLSILRDFLDCDIEKIKDLANFLGLKAYSMIDNSEITLPTKIPEKVFLLYTSNSLSDNIIKLQIFLFYIAPIYIKEILDKSYTDAINEIHITFDPWKNYEEIFTFLNKTIKDNEPTSVYLNIVNGKIVEITSYYKVKLSNNIEFIDFLIKIYPIISIGLVNPSLGGSLYSAFVFDFYIPGFSRKWIKRVIEHEGKT
jgi:hypothetical protein